MNSIHSYLALRLLLGFVLLLSLASILIYFISEKILESDFDARLFAKAQAVVASTSQKGGKIEIDWHNLPQKFEPREKQAGLIQILDLSGHSLSGESFLGSGIFPASERETFGNAQSPQGENLRVLTLPFLPQVEEEDVPVTPPALRQKCLLIVGSDRAPLDRSLGQMADVLVAMTFLASILCLGIVTLALRCGLRPLAALGQEVSEIDETSLEKRIDLDSLPNELLPIAEKLNDLLCRLEVSFARERRFSADVSHELRTPVTELRSLSEVMLRQPHLPADTMQAFQDVLDASRRMDGLVTTLLAIVRGERGTSMMEMEKIDLCAFLQTSWKSYETKAQAKNLKVTLNLPGPFWLGTDSRLFRVVLNNLFSNAVHYTPAGGTIEAGIRLSDNSPVISIQNSTEDVNPKDLPHFFERFWRKDKVRSNSEHMGLGLSLTEMLCQQLQIHLTVSMPTRDSVCFWLTFPTLPDSK